MNTKFKIHSKIDFEKGLKWKGLNEKTRNKLASLLRFEGVKYLWHLTNIWIVEKKTDWDKLVEKIRFNK